MHHDLSPKIEKIVINLVSHIYFEVYEVFMAFNFKLNSFKCKLLPKCQINEK